MLAVRSAHLEQQPRERGGWDRHARLPPANAEALHRLSTDDAIPTLRDNRRNEHLGEDYTHQNKFWRHFGHIVHAASHRLITSNQAGWGLVRPFIRYTAGYQKEEEPERKVLAVPDETPWRTKPAWRWPR